jgi:uncharacterized protein YoxC
MAPDAYSILRHNLTLARRTFLGGHLGLWLLRALSLSAAVLLVATGIVLIAGAGSPLTAVLGFAAVSGIAALLVLAVILPLARTPRLEKVAVMADEILPGRRNLVVSALQIGSRIGALSSFYSREMMEAIVREGSDLSGTLERGRLLPSRDIRSWARKLLLTAATLAAFLVFVPGAFRPAFSSLVLSPFRAPELAAVLSVGTAAEDSVKAPPELAELTVTYEYPPYSGVEKRVVRTVVGDIAALKGTRVGLRADFTRETSSSALAFDNGNTVPMDRESDRRFSASFAVTRDGTYNVSARGRSGLEWTSPPYSIAAEEDFYPFIKLLAPAPETDLDESMELPLEVFCADDYGLSSIHLHFFTNPQNARKQDIGTFPERTRETSLTYFWDTGPLQLLPGESVSYFLEVFDNDAVSGPKSARTPVMTARFPTMAELYASMEAEHSEQVVELEDVLEEARTLKETLEQLAMEMRQDAPVSWEKKKEIEGVGKTSAEMLENIDRVSQALTEDMRKLESHDPVNWELLDKVQELSKLLDEIQSPELKDAIDRLNKALARLDREAIAEAMEQTALSQEDLMQGLDRAIELLKQIKQDEQLRALVEEAIRLAEKQTELADELESSNPDMAEAARGQEDIGDALEQLKQQMEQLAKEAGDKELAEALEEISSSMDKSGLKDMVSQSAGMLRSRRTASLRKLMRDIEAALYRMADSLANAEQQFSSGRTAEVSEKVRRNIHELLEISKAQEELSTCTDRESCGDLALRQQTILDGASSVTDRLLDIAKETPFMTFKTSADLGKSLREMEDALRAFENRKTSEGVAASKEALRLVNDVLKSLLVAQQSMCSGQGGMGTGSGFQRMRSLSGLQQAINRDTEALYSRLDEVGRLSESDEQALSRLAAQQEMVREGMEDVARAMGERKDILGRIEDIIQEMRGVQGRMDSGRLDENLVKQQNQILSRLLDAQRSVQQRDYSGKRYSRPGQDLPGRTPPPELPRELLRESEKLELQMLRERAERYPDTYRELVERYLRALSGGPQR